MEKQTDGHRDMGRNQEETNSHRVINRETDTENQKHRERTIRKTRIEG